MSNITPGRQVADPKDISQPGDWCLQPEDDGSAMFSYLAPDGVLNSSGVGNYDHLWVHTGDKRVGFWQWDGNVDAPTIAPSILHRGASSWHGFFEGGQWRTV